MSEHINIIERFRQIKNKLKALWENEAFLDDIDDYSMLASLLPIPGISQAAQVVNKIANDKQLNIKFTAITQEITAANDRVAKCETDIERALEMAKTLESMKDLKEKVEALVQDASTSAAKSERRGEFIVDTQNYSFQSIINSWIKADIASFSAINHSHNILKDSKVESERTILKAYDHSSNVVDGTEFSSSKGRVGMDRMQTKGHIEVSGAGVGFGVGGSLGFGPGGVVKFSGPRTLSGKCPCGQTIQIAESQLAAVRSYGMACPSCGRLCR